MRLRIGNLQISEAGAGEKDSRLAARWHSLSTARSRLGCICANRVAVSLALMTGRLLRRHLRALVSPHRGDHVFGEALDFVGIEWTGQREDEVRHSRLQVAVDSLEAFFPRADHHLAARLFGRSA